MSSCCSSEVHQDSAPRAKVRRAPPPTLSAMLAQSAEAVGGAWAIPCMLLLSPPARGCWVSAALPHAVAHSAAPGSWYSPRRSMR
eukprot:366570-Chlamydomonas_euryale.AAC.6